MIIVEANDSRIINNQHADGFVIGIQGNSSECFHHFALDEALALVKQIKKLNKKAFIDLTSMYHEEDVESLQNIINQLNDADGFLYHDFLVHSLVPKEKRVYYAPTYMTNKEDFDLMRSDSTYVLASPEVDFESLKRMASEQTWYLTFGTWEIFHSRRPLLTNYFKYRGIKDHKNQYTLKEEFRPTEEYHIVEARGTKIYLNDYYYLGSEIKDLKGHYFIKPFNLPYEVVDQVINIYYQALQSGNFEEIKEGLEALGIKLHQTFLYQKVVLTKGEAYE